MEKDLGYEELLLLAQKLEARASVLAAEADDSQSEGMLSYVASQENSLEQTRFTIENYQNSLIATAKDCINRVDNECVLSLQKAYDMFGVKEF